MRRAIMVLMLLLGGVASAAGPQTRWQRVRTTVGAALIRGVVHGASAVANRMPFARPSRYGVRRTRDVAYLPDGDRRHTLDVYAPERADGPRPIVVYVHGGGFTSLSKETHHTVALEFAKQGYVVFNVDYRAAPRDPFPAAHQDVFAAYEWIVKHAASHGGDLSKLVLAGESAGGNLITSLAIATSQPLADAAAQRVYALGVVPKVVLPACGQLQISGSERVEARKDLSRLVKDRMQDVERAYLGASTASAEERELAEPLLYLERQVEQHGKTVRPLPRFFAFVGTRDPLADDTLRLHAALKRLGVPNDMAIYAEEGHAFHAMRWKKNAKAAWAAMLGFTAEQLATP